MKQLIESDGLSGVRSNPAIFENAIGETGDYDDDIHRLHGGGKSAEETCRELAIKDIQVAADLLRPVFDKTGGEDGFMSLEVSPKLARDTRATIDEAKSWWYGVERPNVMIKIPGTRPGWAAIEQSIADGLNINVTLLFAVDRYRLRRPRMRKVANASPDLRLRSASPGLRTGSAGS